jgi:hypothetical protein
VVVGIRFAEALSDGNQPDVERVTRSRAEDPSFGDRGRPGFLVTTPAFLQYFELSSLSSLPLRDA